MPAKWGTTRAAINTGYGLRSHPEYLFAGPYGTIPTRTPSRGGKALVKGSKEAKLYMARLRAMRGKGYNSSALRGAGLAEIASSLASAIGGQAMETIKKIAERLKVRVVDLLKDPDKLIAILKEIAPKIAEAVKKFFNFIRRKKNPESAVSTLKNRIIEYLTFLKNLNVEMFKSELQRLKDFLMQSITNPKIEDNAPDVPQLPWTHAGPIIEEVD